MANLGTPYRIYYWAKNFQTGLTNVTARVLRPDGSLGSVLTLLAVPDSNFAGLYYRDLSTTISDPAGEWIAMVSSPSEGVKYPHRISFQLPGATDIILERLEELIAMAMEPLRATLDSSEILVSIQNNEELVQNIIDPVLIGTIEEQS